MEHHTAICKAPQRTLRRARSEELFLLPPHPPLRNSALNRATGKYERGYTLAGALCLIAVMSIFMALAVESWSWIKQRDNEEELIFRGKEYTEAIGRYHAKFNSFPPDIDTLVKQKFLRRAYKDPMTKSGKWKVLRPDSLVQTGAAGQINQPGQQTQPGNQDEGNDDHQNQPGQIPTGFNNHSTESQSTSQEADNNDKIKDEEPETETIGPIVGVVSRSKKTSIKVYNDQTTYNKWYFVSAVPQQPQQPKQPQTPPGGKKDKPKKPPGSQEQNPN